MAGRERGTMKVRNMTGRTGGEIPNQFVITMDENKFSGNAVEYFQSYETVICKRDKFRAGVSDRQVWVDRGAWYDPKKNTKTTDKYRNQFLGETKAETQNKIDSGEYILTDLN